MVVYDADAVYGGVYRKGGTRNYTDWQNTMVDDWFESQKVELDPEARRQINQEAELWLNEFSDNHWVTFQLGQLYWLVHKDVKGFQRSHHCSVPVQARRSVAGPVDLFPDRV